MCRLTDGSRAILVHNFICTIFKSVREAIRLLSYSNLSTSLLVILFLSTNRWFISYWNYSYIYSGFFNENLHLFIIYLVPVKSILISKWCIFPLICAFENFRSNLVFGVLLHKWLWRAYDARKTIKYSSWWEGFKTITL